MNCDSAWYYFKENRFEALVTFISIREIASIYWRKVKLQRFKSESFIQNNIVSKDRNAFKNR